MNKKAFTLAEALVTISILGVIAALTIPSIAHKVQDRIAITQVKKAYSMLDNAIQQMYAIEGNPKRWNWSSASDRSEFFMQKLAEYLPVLEYCGSNTGCIPINQTSCVDGYSACIPSYKLLNGANGDIYARIDNKPGKMILKNGMMLAVNSFELSYDGILVLQIDINGNKGPNRYGYDVFFFDVSNNGLRSQKHDVVSYNNTHGMPFASDLCKKNQEMSRQGFSVQPGYAAQQHGLQIP